jgi:exodeoxyribonuclease X
MTAYIFDTEWTDRDRPEIIEAAWIRMPVTEYPVTDPELIIASPDGDFRSFEERYCPSGPISFGAMAVHHILPHELEGKAPSTAFELPIDVAYLVGHSIDSDWEVAGSPANVKRICTHAIAQHLFLECDALSLSALLYYTGGATEVTRSRVRQAHGAMADCWNVLQLLRVILERKPTITTWSALWQYSEACREPLKMPMGKNRGAFLTDCETGELEWYLGQGWIDPYFRKALEKVVKSRSRDLFSDLEDEAESDFDDLRNRVGG